MPRWSYLPASGGKDGEPLLMVEVKTSDLQVSPALRKMQDALAVPAIQRVNQPGINRSLRNGENRIRVVSAANWLATLG